ncbi:MAG: AAA family ATPase, partial [Lachnospiraceae bacterium]|nr:AAA family ATPase [Lachnospiraceae bacterium]
MNIGQAKREIRNAVLAYLTRDENGEYSIPTIRQRPILLMGPPGIGKTQIMEQIAAECDLGLVAYTITHHTRQSAIGLPYIRQKIYGGKEVSVTEYTMSEIIASVYDTMEESGRTEGILFIDEINCASETLSPAMLQFLQGKTFGNQKVPKGWIIVAAGNPPEYNRSVREFDVVTLDRVKVIQVEADYDAWKTYALGVGIHGSILAYLDIHKENFYRMETTVDGKWFVTARGWEDLSQTIYVYEKLRIPVTRELAIQYLQHPACAADFAAFYDLYQKYKSDYQIDEILSGTIRPGTLNKLKFAAMDERLEVVGLILTRLFEDFRQRTWQQEVTDRCFELTKAYRQRLQEYDKAQGGSEESSIESASESAMQGASKGASKEPAIESAVAGTSKKPVIESVTTDISKESVIKSAASGAGQDWPLQVMQKLRKDEDTWWREKERAGHNEKRTRQFAGEMREFLDKCLHALKDEIQKNRAAGTGEGIDAGQAFTLVRESFEEKSAALDALEEQIGEKLEYAFDFMETAFGEGDEMVVFITELSTNPASMQYLKEHDHDRYYRYNKSLLFDGREADILQQLDEIRDMQ